MMTHKKFIPTILLVVFSLFLTLPHVFAQTMITDLGTISGTNKSEAFGINDLGQVVGHSTNWQGGGINFAVLWNSGVITDLGTLGGVATYAYDINNVGQIVGWSQDSINRNILPFIWENGIMRELSLPYPLNSNSIAYGLNDSGIVVGEGHGNAIVWHDNTYTDLGVGSAKAINNLGQVVGWRETPDSSQHAFLWQNGVFTDLGDLGGGRSIAFGINDAGQVVGESATVAGPPRAFLWQNGVMTDLDSTIPAGYCSEAFGINDVGQIVGHRFNCGNSTEEYPMLWENGVATQLGTLGGSFGGTSAINNKGNISGYSRYNDMYPNEVHATLWTVPILPPTPQQQIQGTVNQVQSFINSGVIPNGSGNALESKLDSATKKLNDGKIEQTRKVLLGFIKEIEGMMVKKVISQTDGTTLINSTNAILSQLGGV